MHKGENFPIEEFSGVPDWNAKAWEKIKARQEEESRKQSLIEFLSEKPTSTLNAMLKVCIHEQQDPELQELIITELKERNYLAQ